MVLNGLDWFYCGSWLAAVFRLYIGIHALTQGHRAVDCWKGDSNGSLTADTFLAPRFLISDNLQRKCGAKRQNSGQDEE